MVELRGWDVREILAAVGREIQKVEIDRYR